MAICITDGAYTDRQAETHHLDDIAIWTKTDKRLNKSSW